MTRCIGPVTRTLDRWRGTLGRLRWLARLQAACTYLLAAVFLMAGITKVTDLETFTDRMVLHSGLPGSLAQPVAAFLPWLELTCGLCVLLNRGRREAVAILTVLLFVLFAYSLWHIGDSDCGCFVFPRSTPLSKGWGPPVRNFVLLLCGLVACWPGRRLVARSPGA